MQENGMKSQGNSAQASVSAIGAVRVDSANDTLIRIDSIPKNKTKSLNMVLIIPPPKEPRKPGTQFIMHPPKNPRSLAPWFSFLSNAVTTIRCPARAGHPDLSG